MSVRAFCLVSLLFRALQSYITARFSKTGKHSNLQLQSLFHLAAKRFVEHDHFFCGI